MIHRREFITHMAGGLLGGLYVAQNGLGGFLKGGLDKIGLQLYTVRRELQKDFEGTLARVAAERSSLCPEAIRASGRPASHASPFS